MYATMNCKLALIGFFDFLCSVELKSIHETASTLEHGIFEVLYIYVSRLLSLQFGSRRNYILFPLRRELYRLICLFFSINDGMPIVSKVMYKFNTITTTILVWLYRNRKWKLKIDVESQGIMNR